MSRMCIPKFNNMVIWIFCTSQPDQHPHVTCYPLCLYSSSFFQKILNILNQNCMYLLTLANFNIVLPHFPKNSFNSPTKNSPSCLRVHENPCKRTSSAVETIQVLTLLYTKYWDVRVYLGSVTTGLSCCLEHPSSYVLCSLRQG